MKSFVVIIAIVICAAVAEQFLPWWSVAVVAFTVVLIAGMRPGKGFLTGFCGVGLWWLLAALWHDNANEHILSQKMAVVFGLHSSYLFVLVTALVGALVGGLAAWGGALLRNARHS
jgi:small basic protein